MSKKLNSTLHFLLVMLFPQIAYIQAQSFVDPKWSEKILSDDSYKVLVVVQKPVKVNELKAFKKDPELVKLYLDALNSFNANWTEAVKECWKIHQNLQYVSVDELELVRELDFGLQPSNFISSSVKIFAGSPAYDCKFCLA